jgi:hypothetical protein
VRRSLAVEIAVARAALVDVQLSMRAVGADAPSSRPQRRGRGWLELADVAPVAAGRELRLLGALHVGRCGRAVPVDVVLAPWSMSRSELRLQLRRRSELPRHYFEVAHRVIDILRDELQRTTAAAPRASAS